jgi:hypothetical protein
LDDAFDDELGINDAVEMVDRTVKVLEQQGLASLVMRLPKNGRRGQKRSRK